MFTRGLIVFYCFLIRDIPLRRSPKYKIFVSWISTFLPTLMLWETTSSISNLIGQLITIIGIVIFTITCLELGESFGISPAVRKNVSGGIYSYISHPMYISHMIVEIGILVASPTLRNFEIAIVTWLLYLIRASWERDLVIPTSKIELCLQMQNK